MNIFKKIKEKGISLKTAHTLMIVVSIIIAGILLYETINTSFSYRELSKATDEYIELQKNAYSLTDASDYLTREVQCYTVTCERVHMDNYFNEAEVKCTRENALQEMKKLRGDTEAYRQLRNALDESVKLMSTEYYAIRLVLEAVGDTDYPQAVSEIELSPEDKALSKEEKINKAQSLVHDNDYYRAKSAITADMDKCLDNLEKQVQALQETQDTEHSNHVKRLLVLIFIETIAVIFTLGLTFYLGIKPIITSVEEIKNDSFLKTAGSTEFRYLADAYNKMYSSFKKDIANLNYDASHDKLTGLYNRAGYELLRENLDLSTTAILLIDADNFKTINDTYGHTIGDCVLKKIANILNHTFRSEDYVCRLGGDEFAVFMMHVNSDLRDMIDKKIRMINEQLSDPRKDSMPPISLSVGVAFGEGEESVSSMTKHADEALYKVKERGRCGCCFY